MTVEDPFQRSRLMGEAAARRSRYAATRLMTTPSQAKLAVQTSQYNPALPPSAIQSGATMGLRPDDPAYAELNKAVSKEQRNLFEKMVYNSGGAIGKVFNAAVGKPLGIIGETAKDSLRTAGVAADWLWEEIVAGTVRETYKTKDPLGIKNFQGALSGDIDPSKTQYGRSVGSLAVNQLLAGEPVNVGDGFLAAHDPEAPGANIVQQSEDLRHELQIADGVGVSLGTVGANTFWEPGTREFDSMSGFIDAGTRLALDPANIIGGKIAEVSRRAKGFGPLLRGSVPTAAVETANKFGLVSGGLRRTIVAPLADDYLKGKQGTRVAEYIADTNSFSEIQAIIKARDPNLILKMAETRDVNQIKGMWRHEIGRSMTEKPNATSLRTALTDDVTVGQRFGDVIGNEKMSALGFGPTLRASFRNTRAGELMGKASGELIDLHDEFQGIEDLTRFTDTASFSGADKDALKSSYVRLVNGLKNDPNVGTADIDKFRDNLLGAFGRTTHADTIEAEALTAVKESFQSLYGTVGKGAKLNDLGLMPDENVLFGFLDGEMVNVQNAVVPIADIATTPLVSEIASRGIALPPAELIRKSVSRTSNLARIMKLSRKDLDKRALTNLMSSSMNVWRPAMLLRPAWPVRIIPEEQMRMMSEDLPSAFNHPIDYLLGHMAGRRSVDIFNDDLSRSAQFNKAMSQGHGGWLGSQRNRIKFANATEVIRPDDDAFVDAYMTQLFYRQQDPVTKQLLEFGKEDTADWLYNRAGRTHLNDVEQFSQYKDVKKSRAVLNDYLDNLEAETYQLAGGEVALEGSLKKVVTTGNEEILNFFKTGKLAGNKLRTKQDVTAFRESLKKQQDFFPDMVMGSKQQLDSDQKGKWVSAAFEMVGSKPTNYLSRSPAFKSYYWNEMEELIPYASREVQNNILKTAKSTVSRKQYSRMITQSKNQLTGGFNIISDAVDMDDFAKAQAMSKSKDLLYDLSSNSNMGEMVKNFIPFFDAFIEVTTTWGKQLTRDPSNLRKAQLVIDGAKTNGYFDTDEYGNQIFTYPGSGMIYGLLGINGDNAEGRLTGNAQSLNTATTSVVPGIGPVVQIPLSFLMSDSNPALAGLEQMLMPYGKRTPKNPTDLFLATAPSWMREGAELLFKNDPATIRALGDTTVEILQAGYLNGTYDPANVDANLIDARAKAQKLTVLTAIGAAALPTPPKRTWAMNTDQGELDIGILGRAYYDLLEKTGDPTAARDAFMQTYGSDPTVLIQSSNVTIAPRPVNEGGYQYWQDNEDLFRAFPGTARFATDDSGEFSFDSIIKSREEGTSENLTPDEWNKLTNTRLAQIELLNIKSAMDQRKIDPNSDKARAYIRHVKSQLEEKYEGYGYPIPGMPEKISLDQKIEELRYWADEPRLASTPAGEAVGAYMQARDQIIASAASEDIVSWQTAQSTAKHRAYLSYVASEIVKQAPDFATVWDQVLRYELGDEAALFDPRAETQANELGGS